jgi:predicted dehydrogenase
MASRTRRRTSRTKGGSKGRNKAIRYAVVGLGYISQIALLPAFKNAKRNSTLAALVSGDQKKLKLLGRRYGVERLCSYDDYDELLESGEIDAVYIGLPNHLHCDYTVRAANAGVHVLCEKPLAVTPDECRTMIEACDRNGVKLMTAYRLHFERANLEVAEIARSGKLGELRYFSSNFGQQVAAGNVRLDAEKGGGPVQDMGIYCINAVRSLFGAEPVEVLAAAVSPRNARFREVAETVTAVMKFPKERIATFTCSFGTADRSQLELVGTKGSVTADPIYEIAQGLGYTVRIGERTRAKRYEKSDQFAPELLYFSDCVLANRDPEPDGEEGLADVRVIQALMQSLESGRWVQLEIPQKRRRPRMSQEIRKPGIQPPTLVDAESPSG